MKKLMALFVITVGLVGCVGLNKNSSERVVASTAQLNPFIGKWCASKENEYHPGEIITFSKGNTIESSSSAGKLEWIYTYNPATRMVIGNMQFETKSGVRNQHPDKDNGMSVLFYLSEEGKLIWSGPVVNKNFLNINQQNLGEYLLMDARVYKMTYEPCEFIGV